MLARRAGGRPPRAPHRPGLRRRRPLGPEAPRGRSSAWPATHGRRGPRPARLHRRPRHLAHGGRGLPRARRGLDGGGRDRARIGSVDRALLRDGPRQPLGAHRAGAGPPRSTARPSTRRPSGPAAVRAAYERGETDEFVTPTRVGEEAPIDPERDSVIAFNFRPDRMRQTLRRPWPSGRVRRYATMTEYEEGWPYPVAFPPQRPATTLAAVAGRARGEAAPRRRDREVPARDVLLQRRRRRTEPRASSASSCPRRATSRPTTRSRR